MSSMDILKSQIFVVAAVAGIAAVVLYTGSSRAEMADVEIRSNQQPYPAVRAPSLDPFFGRGAGRFREVPIRSGRGVRGPGDTYDLAPADVSLAISYAHKRQYPGRAYQYLHHYPYNYFGHPYRAGFRVKLAN